MKRFQVTVNGNVYEVEVEELAGGASVTPTPVVSAPQPAAKSPAVKKSSGAVGGTKVEAPMPGVILDIRVKEGDKVKEGDVVAILEAMKMENEIVAPAAGTITSINV